MGKLAFPSLIAQAAAPSIGTLLMLRLGPGGTLAALTVLCFIKVALVAALHACVRTRSASVKPRRRISSDS
jgi:hypothetical protein